MISPLAGAASSRNLGIELLLNSVHIISSFRCVTNGRPDSGPTGRFAFSFLYFVIVVNSLVLDVFFYGR